MEALLVLLGGGALTVWALAEQVRRRKRRRAAWTEAARVCHLTELHDVTGLLFSRGVIGRSGPLVVRIQGYAVGKQDRGTRVIVEGAFDDVTLRGESLSTALEKKLGAREIELGDWRFDDSFYIGGDPAAAFALLDDDIRAKLMRLGERGRLTLEGHRLTLDLPIDGEPLVRELKAVLPLALHCSKRFAESSARVERLAENARHDASVLVRLNTLLVLIRQFGHHPKTTETLHALLQDTNAEIRLRAATSLGGPEGRAALLDLLDAPTPHDRCFAEAVIALGAELPLARAVAVLDRAVALGHSHTIEACVSALGRSGNPEAVAPLARLLAETDKARPSAARALAQIGSATGEAPLIGALVHDDADVRVAAAEALGYLGSISAVLPLKEASERFGERRLRSAARQAVAEIQARAGGASPGQLSMAVADAGRLSIADQEAGRLAVAPHPSGDDAAEHRRKP